MASLLIVLLVGPIWLYGRTVGTKIFLERNIGPNRTAKQQQSPAEPWENFLKNILKHQATQWYWMVLLRSKKLQKNFFWTSKQRFMRFMRFMRHCAYSIQWCAQTNSQITTPSSISDTCQEAAHKVNTVPLDVHN